MGRMRESDDYLTARAANPRTGLISPSVTSVLTPRTPLTPGEALALYASPPSPLRQEQSVARPQPTPQQRFKGTQTAPLQRTLRKSWRCNDKGWWTEPPSAVPASPHTDVVNSTTEARNTVGGGKEEDRFVVHMPSAREPQPYAFPGHNAAQIAAFQHCQWKSRQISNQEKGQCMKSRMLSVGSGPRKFAEASEALRVHATTPQRHDTVVERPEVVPGAVEVETTAPVSPSLGSKARVAPSDSSRCSSTATTSTHATSLSSCSSTSTSPTITLIPRKPISPRPTPRTSNALTPPTSSATEEGQIAPSWLDVLAHSAHAATDLRHLPPVKLVHPAYASMPRTAPRSAPPASEPSMSFSHTPLHSRTRSTAAEPASTASLPACVSSLLSLIALADLTNMNHIHHLLHPSPLFRTLSSPTATPTQRFDALKTALIAAAQTAALLYATVLLWRV
ncbi:hypothetical protein LTR60_004968, partial [Cryomyces antarcticus]